MFRNNEMLYHDAINEPHVNFLLFTKISDRKGEIKF